MADQEKWELSREEIEERITEQNQKHKKKGSLDLKGHNFLSLCLFLNVSHFDRLSTAKGAKMEPLVDLRVDLPKRKSLNS